MSEFHMSFSSKLFESSPRAKSKISHVDLGLTVKER